MSVIESILKAREANINDYKRISRLFSDYEEENKTIKDYNGRQILELLQNADDESSSEVEIDFSSSERLLIVSNIGTPFSEKGFESLLLPNNSPKKSKKKYIGNKGLGFRSILNWAERVEIISNGCSVKFSREIAQRVVETELSEQLSEIQKFKEERGDKPEAFRYPILSLPSVEEFKGKSKWTTEIKIYFYEEYENEIKDQLKFLSEEVLLFVRNIKTLIINEDGFSRTLTSICEPHDDYNEYVIDQLSDGESQTKIYHVYPKTDVFPEEYQKENDKKEPLFYEIAVAVEMDCDSSKGDNYLYSFFRTDIKIPLPCIIHGTFELNSSRNTCIVDKKNDFIWKKIAELLLYVSKKLQKINAVATWDSYELLALKRSCSYLESLLNKYLFEEPIYPCCDDKYRKAEESVFYSDRLNSEVEKRYSKFFPLMVKYYERAMSRTLLDKFIKYAPGEFWTTWNKIALSPELTLEDRVDLVCLLASLKNFEPDHYLPLLLDGLDNVIDADVDVYTPARQAEPPVVPKFMNVRFLNERMYDALVARLVPSSETNKARGLCDLIKGFVNIQAYDISNLTPKIITRCNKLASESNDASYIKETVQALYANAKNSSSDRINSEVKYNSILLVARDGSFASPLSLYFSKTYEFGKVTEGVYGDHLVDSQYLVDKDFWEIEDSIGIENFFEMLGVERSIKCWENSLSNEDYAYYDAELKKVSCEKYEKYYRRPNSSVFQLLGLNVLNELSSSQILALISNSELICNRLSIRTVLYYWCKGDKGQYHESVEKPYIAYQLRHKFSNVIIDNDDSDIDSLIDEQFKIDYTYLENMGISPSRANILLERLGACRNLDDYDSEVLYALIKKIPQKYPDGKRVTKIYGLIYDILKKRENVAVPDDLVLACRIDDKIEYKPSNEIYYYDDATLPQSALKKIPILLFRQRAGVSAVTRLFNVCKLNASLLSIIESSVKNNKYLTSCFAQEFHSRKPYILAYRLRPIKGLKEKNEEASKIEKLSIILIDGGMYNTQQDSFELDVYDFVIKENIVYIRVPNIHYTELRRDQQFLDVCSEILGIVFALESSDMKIIFKSVLRNDPDISKYDIISERGADYLQDCLELLKMNETDESRFWNNILRAKGKEEYTYSSGEKIKEYVTTQLGIVLPDEYDKIDFVNFKNETSYEFLKKICSDLDIEVSVCLPIYGLVHYYQNKLENLVLDNKSNFKALLWNQLNKLPIENERDRLDFVEKIYKYEGSYKVINLASCKFVFDVDLLPLLKDYIKREFEIDICSENIPAYEEKNYYSDIISEDDLDDRLTKLSIFEGYEELFKVEAEKIKSIENKKDDDLNINENDNKNIPFDYTHISPRIPNDDGLDNRDDSSQENDNGSSEGTDNDPRKPRNVPRHLNALKDKAGRDAEERTKRALKEQGYEYHVKSSATGGIDSDDSAHYDIRYKKKNTEEWRFLEVKHIADSSFILSPGELDFIFEGDNKYKYDLALVKKGKVHIDEAPFVNEANRDDLINKYGAEEVGFRIPFNFHERKDE